MPDTTAATTGPLRRPANIPIWLWDAVQDLYGSLEEFDERAGKATRQARRPDTHERVWCNATAHLLLRSLRHHERIRNGKVKS